MKMKLPTKPYPASDNNLAALHLAAKESIQPETEGILDIFSIRDAIEASIPPPLANPWMALGKTESPNYIKNLEADPNTNEDLNLFRFEYRLNQLQLPKISFTPMYKYDFQELPASVADALSSLVAEDRRYSFNISQLTELLQVAFKK